MSNEDSLSSRILTNIQFIAEIYSVINIAASKTIIDPFVTSVKNNVNIVKPNINGLTRYAANCRSAILKNRNISNTNKCIKSNKYLIEYNENDIMIVGGAALNIYDYLLKEFKNRRGISPMEEYIKKKTSDIDIVWWPRLTAEVSNPTVSINNEIILSSSTAIENLVLKFKQELELEFNRKEIKERIISQIEPFINNIDINTLFIKINWLSFYAAGVHKLEVDFDIKGQILKMVDISIHDSGASQKNDIEGKLINDLRPMTEDPVFCDSLISSINSIKSFPIKLNNGSEIIVKVPSIYSFIEQQMFAFDNLIRDSQLKAFINYKRVEYIKLILEKWQNENKSDLNIIGANISSELNHITDREQFSINIFGKNILKVCKTKPDDSDKYVNKLCNKIVESVKKDIIIDLNRIYQNFDDTYQLTRKPRFKKYKKRMYELRNQIEDLKTKYRQVTTEELLKNTNIGGPIGKSKEVYNIIEEERQIRASIMKMNRSNEIKISNRTNQKTSIDKQSSILPLPSPSPKIEFGSIYISTTNNGINIFKSNEGIYWYINPIDGKILRKNPWSGNYEYPEKRNPSDGLGIKESSNGIKFIDYDVYKVIIRLNPYTINWEQIQYGFPLNYGLVAPQTGFISTNTEKTGKNSTNKRRLNNNNNTRKK